VLRRALLPDVESEPEDCAKRGFLTDLATPEDVVA
jgi:hypothetical protein